MKYLALLVASAGFACAAEFVTGQAARLIIGQETFTSQLPGASEFRVGAASGLAFVNDTLFVADSSRIQADPQNNRVLIYNNLSSKLPGPKDELTGGVRCAVCGGSADVVVGQSDFVKTDIGLTPQNLRTPTSVATDGRILAIADTDNNRVLIWNSIPMTNGAPADIVVGQTNFTSNTVNSGGAGNTPSATGLRGPQGVWIQNGKLYVADTLNHRVLIWNSIPTQNGQAADIVLGKPDFTTFVQPDLTQAVVNATASTLLNPVSVTSDGQRLYVTDLGHNRVLIWNSIPTQNAQPADVAVGQPDVISSEGNNAVRANNSRALCAPVGRDDAGVGIFPDRCAATLNFPRYALSDGTRLFVADGGNDRVLIWNVIPNNNGVPANVVLGQLNDQLAQDTGDLRISAADSLRTPMSLAWDGASLYVSDPYNRRILAFTPGDQPLPYTGVRNAASQEIFAVGVINFTADPKENDEVTLKIANDAAEISNEYKYKATASDRVEQVITGLVEAVNAGDGDPLVFATPNTDAAQIILTAKDAGDAGNGVTITFTPSSGAQIAAETTGRLTGGQDAAKIAPGTLVVIVGENFTTQTVQAPADANPLPTKLGGVEVFFDGIPGPLMSVSPTQIISQMPWDVSDTTSVSAYVRTQDANGNVRISTAIGVPIIPQAPGVFASPGSDPRPAIAVHGTSYATGAISIDGTPSENNVATVIIDDREYNYTVKKDDTAAIVRDALIAAINANEDERVTASAASVYTRMILTAKAPGAEGEGVGYAARTNDGATFTISALSSGTCCANTEGAPITEENPARPGELIIIYGTGLGFVQPDDAKNALSTGYRYNGPVENTPNSPIDAIAGGKTANVLFAGLKQGEVGMYEVKLQLNSDIPTNPQTQLTIAQDIYISNIVTFAVVNPNTPEE